MIFPLTTLILSSLTFSLCSRISPNIVSYQFMANVRLLGAIAKTLPSRYKQQAVTDKIVRVPNICLDLSSTWFRKLDSNTLKSICYKHTEKVYKGKDMTLFIRFPAKLCSSCWHYSLLKVYYADIYLGSFMYAQASSVAHVHISIAINFHYLVYPF